MRIFSITVVMLLLVVTTNTFSQDLKWNNQPHTGFVFQITNKEAQKLLTVTSDDSIVTKMLHTQVDTFDTRVGWKNRPSKGHFILAKIVSNEIYCEYTSVFPYQVFLLNEYDALALQVLDMEGNVRNDAKVKLKLHKIPFDDAAKTYRLENKWFYGNEKVVTVELDGFRSVFNIQRNEAPAWSQHYSYENSPSFYSYMITDKNKYKPGEKVRFKSFALSQSRSPLHRDLSLWLSYRDKDYRYIQKKISVVSPHRPGSFVGEFQLHDSLKMKLDQSYDLELKDRSGRIVARRTFRYEDYELNGNNLEIHLASNFQYHPSSNQLSIVATDNNGLMMKDGRAIIVVRTHDINEIFQPVAILKDTLMIKEVELNPGAPTTFDIPSGIFQKTNTDYEVYVTVLNAENQRVERMVSGKHLYSQYEFRARIVADSIVYEVLDNGTLVKKVPGTIAYDEAAPRQVTFPLKEKLNAGIRVVNLKTEKVSRKMQLDGLDPELEIRGGIKNDSLRLSLYNPHKLETSWYIYKGSELIEKGFGTEMTYDSSASDHSETYYVELLYTFGGTEQIERKTYEFHDKYLDIDLQIPDRAFPGQTVDALVQVKNQSGIPVNNVDLTAFAVTSKLGYYAPDLPYYGDVSDARPERDTFEKDNLSKRSVKLKLNYNKWAKKAGLDTMIYYKFTYPLNGMFRHSVPIPDSTQFAPFVMKDGKAQTIYVIEVDREPVYYSWVDEPHRYSFYAPIKKKVLVTVRLFDRVLLFDSLMFERGKKTIFSVDLDHLPANVRTIKIDLPKKKYKKEKVYPSFTPIEVRRHTENVSIFKASYGRSYLEWGRQRFIPLFYGTSTRKSITVGPATTGRQTYHDSWNNFEITYQHNGGFTYAFEDNVVYKLDAKDLIPKQLSRGAYEPLIHLNDVVMTKKEFFSIVVADATWHTRIVDVSDKEIRMKVYLPEEKAKSGFKSFLFENPVTGDISSPCQLTWKVGNYTSSRRGLFNIIALYNNGTYIRKDSIDFKSYTKIAVDLINAQLHEADELSERWMLTSRGECFSETKVVERTIKSHGRDLDPRVGNIRGVVYTEEDGGPLPGVNVIVKGTTNGTTTDENGEFALDAEQLEVTLSFSFIGYQTQEIDVQVGSDVVVHLVVDVQQLSEVVVTGYSTESRRSLTGSVSTISSMENAKLERDEDEDDDEDDITESDGEAELYRDLLNLKTIRSNFSDVGFWEPKLYTDKRGQAKFTVTYPDDITQWNAVVYGMNRYLQTGTARKGIKSYKPIMAQLAVPNFLTVGDSAVFTGKVLNYTDNKNISGKLKWSREGANSEKPINFSEFQIDNYAVNVANTDSVKTGFVFTRDDGYMDGEERKVPVVEQGVIRADGSLTIANNNETRKIRAGVNETISVEIMADPLDVYEGEIKYLLNYQYACNEQLASKLLGLINYKRLNQFDGKDFLYDKDIDRIIARLLKNQNQEFLWSWWNAGPGTSYWMSAHILRALKTAADAGYNVDLNIGNLEKKADYKYQVLRNYALDDIDLLNVLAEWKVNLKYGKIVGDLDTMIWKATAQHRHTTRYTYPNERFLLQEIRQLTNNSYKADSILRYKKEGILGDIHFSDDRPHAHWWYDELTMNATAYRILRRDPAMSNLKGPMQLYFINERRKGAWNTFESSTILLNVLPDLLAAGATRKKEALVKLSGKVNTAIEKFPYSVTLNAGEELAITNQAGLPVYVMQYKKERVIKAKTGVDGFEIKTSLNNNTNLLEAGKPSKLTVEVNVKKDSDLEYVMIEIPIPGSCSYQDKIQRNDGIETHREYFKDRTVVFCENMKSGRYTFEVNLLPRFTGKYFVNPSQVSLMYVPVVNANTEMKRVVVR